MSEVLLNTNFLRSKFSKQIFSCLNSPIYSNFFPIFYVLKKQKGCEILFFIFPFVKIKSSVIVYIRHFLFLLTNFLKTSSLSKLWTLPNTCYLSGKISSPVKNSLTFSDDKADILDVFLSKLYLDLFSQFYYRLFWFSQ